MRTREIEKRGEGEMDGEKNERHEREDREK